MRLKSLKERPFLPTIVDIGSTTCSQVQIGRIEQPKFELVDW